MTPVQFLRYAYRQFRGLLIFRRRVGVFGHFTVGNARNIRIGRDCGINHGVFILGHNRIEIGDGVVARMNPDTGEVENLEILFFSDRFAKLGDLLHLPLRAKMTPPLAG